MAGSSLAPILIPIGAVLALVFWLGMVFYADAHPVHRPGPPAAPAGRGPRAAVPGPKAQAGERVPRQERREVEERARAGQPVPASEGAARQAPERAPRAREPVEQARTEAERAGAEGTGAEGGRRPRSG